jgi:hypothetical protein
VEDLFESPIVHKVLPQAPIHHNNRSHLSVLLNEWSP